TWCPSAAHLGYLLLSLSASGLTFLPSGAAPLPASATSFAEVAVLTDPMYCYMLLPVQGAPLVAIGNSDVLCTLTGLRTILAPGGFTVRLNESNLATLTWTAFQSDPSVDYVLLALNANGLRFISVPHGTLSVADDTGGLS